MFEDREGLAHRNSTDTSHAAASALVNSGAKRRKVFDHIARALEEGITADALEVATGWDGNTIRPRVNELMSAGIVEYSDRKERTRKGRLARTIVLTDVGIDLALSLL